MMIPMQENKTKLGPSFGRFLVWVCGCEHVCACIWKPEVGVRCLPQLLSTLLVEECAI